MFKIIMMGLKLIILVLVNSFAFASQADFDQAFQQGINTAARHKQQAQEVFSQFKAENTFKNYTEAPSQSQYYGGVTQTSTPIKHDAVDQAAQSDVAKSIQQAQQNQQQIDKQALQQEIARVSQIQDHAYDIVNGISDEFVDCTKQQSCTTQYEDKQCEEAPESIAQVCKKSLSIDMVPHQEDTHYYLTAYLAVSDHHYAGVSVNAINGGIGFLGPHDAGFRLDGRLPGNIDCNVPLQGNIISEQGNARLDNIGFPNCSNGFVLSFHISAGHTKTIKLDIVSSKITYEPKDHWNDDCLGLANSKFCTFQSEQCVQPAATRVIQAIPVTRNCWEKELSYLCNGSSGIKSTCAPLRNQGCEQINSVCEEKSEGGCAKYSRTYRCPIKQCKNTGIICNGQSYCLDGDCVNHQKQADADFQKTVSALSASMDAAKQFDQHFVFSGQAKSCRNFILGAAYCCADEGWLLDNKLISCNEEEKKLGNEKENGLVHYIGRYEEGCVAGICTKKIKSYCTFPSKLARIVQEQGREQQLGRHFGDAENPDCSGLTTDELQKIDFSRIDFKEFYDDIAKNQSVEDQKKLASRIQDEMKSLIDNGKSHDDKK
jgi:conjugal transfer mating pair stabilization protein TraN